MTRFLLEKPANFSDIEKVVLGRETLEIDSTIVTRFGKKGEALTQEQITESIGKIEHTQNFTCIDCGVKKCTFAIRSIIYSLICTVNQLKKSFTLEIVEYLIQLINQSHDFEFFDYNEASCLAELFSGESKSGLSIPDISCKQLELLVSMTERIIYAGLSLYAYLVNKNLYPFAVASFAVHLEAVGCDLKFLEEITAINVDNRALVNELTILEKFFLKRNNKSGKGTPEMLENCLLFIEYKQNVKDLKFKIKDFFGGEFNPTLKAAFWETKFLSKIWKSVAFNLQKITLTAFNLC